MGRDWRKDAERLRGGAASIVSGEGESALEIPRSKSNEMDG